MYFHGNGRALVDRVPRFRMFTARGYALLVVSYRGYGGSRGSPTQSGLMQDGEAAYRAVRARGYDGDRIVLMGASVETGVAILAARHESAALVSRGALFVSARGHPDPLPDFSGALVDACSVPFGSRDP